MSTTVSEPSANTCSYTWHVSVGCVLTEFKGELYSHPGTHTHTLKQAHPYTHNHTTQHTHSITLTPIPHNHTFTSTPTPTHPHPCTHTPSQLHPHTHTPHLNPPCLRVPQGKVGQSTAIVSIRLGSKQRTHFGKHLSSYTRGQRLQREGG